MAHLNLNVDAMGPTQEQARLSVAESLPPF